MTDSPVIDTKAHRSLRHIGVPARIYTMPEFSLKRRVSDILLSDKKVITKTKQVQDYIIATEDAPGWFMLVQSAFVLDRAKHIAANIAKSYVTRGLSVTWLSSFNKPPTGSLANLYILDALFEDASTYTRDKIYEMMSACDSTQTSLLLLAKSNDMVSTIGQIGAMPHLMLSIT